MKRFPAIIIPRSPWHPPTRIIHGRPDLLCQTEVLLGWDHTDRVGVAHTTAPALDTDDVVALVNNAELDTVGNTPLETAVDVLLPDLDVEVRLLLREEEWIDATIQVGILH